jgi:PleD family two-component response regulator
MKYPQIVVYESGGWLAGQIKRLASENGWLVRESRREDTCLNLVQDGRPTVFLLYLEKDLLEGLSLVARVREVASDCSIVLVSDVKMDTAEQRSQLSTLAFDLGARYVLFPPLQQPVIEDLVAGLMASTISRVVSDGT